MSPFSGRHNGVRSPYPLNGSAAGDDLIRLLHPDQCDIIEIVLAMPVFRLGSAELFGSVLGWGILGSFAPRAQRENASTVITVSPVRPDWTWALSTNTMGANWPPATMTSWKRRRATA